MKQNKLGARLFTLVILLVSTSTLNAFSNVRKYTYSDVITWYFTCSNEKSGSVNYAYNTKQYYANSKGTYPHYSSMQSAANAECKSLKKNNLTYGYIKKGAIIFSRLRGEHGIEKALSWNDPTDHSKGNKMWTMELATIYGELPTNGKRQKIRLYEKYTKPNLSGSYWKIKDGSKIRYIAEEHIDF